MGDCTPREGGSGESGRQLSGTDLVVAQLARIESAIFDSALIQNPWAFAGTSSPTPVPIDLGANDLGDAVVAFRNDLQVPVMVLVRLQTDGTGQKAYLQGAINDQDRASSYAKGADTVFGETPKFAEIVGPGEQLWAAGQSFGGVVASTAILVHAISFRGRQTLARRG